MSELRLAVRNVECCGDGRWSGRGVPTPWGDSWEGRREGGRNTALQADAGVSRSFQGVGFAVGLWFVVVGYI